MTGHRPLSLVAALMLGACVAGPPAEVETPAPVLPDRFAYAPDPATRGSVNALLPVSDPAYQDLSAIALAGAPELGEAAARIDAARARAALAGANRQPRLDADASIRGQRTSPAQFGSQLPPGIGIDTERVSYGANLTASWDPDLFGRLRARERAALARIDAASADAQGVRTALLSEIAGAVVDWRTIDARVAALEGDLQSAMRLESLAASREAAGIAPGFDRIRARSAVEATQSRIASLGSERARIAGRLVTLTARPARQVLAALEQPASLPAEPAAPAALPSALLTHRPDIRAAAANLAASDAQLYAASAARFPRLTLSAALGLLAFSPADLFDGDAIVGNAGAGLLAPLLDFGRIEAEIDEAAANKRSAFQSYRRAVFAALGEAESAYGLIAAADRELAATQAEARSAQRAASLAETRFAAGLSNFLEVLDARRAADASGERAAAARGRAQRARILLWQALGGEGFDPVPPARTD
jgi:NodT family efflux transporter outer membrane factor (OMF) lipoprotein